MPTVWGKRVGVSLVPFGMFQRMLANFPEGERLRIKIDMDRNGKFNSLFHVMLELLVRAINRGPAQTSIDSLKQWVKLRTGRYDLVKLPNPAPDGTTHAIDYHSTSFAKMGEDEFHQFCVDACELIRAELAPWVSGSDEWGEAQKIVNSIAPEQA